MFDLIIVENIGDIVRLFPLTSAVIAIVFIASFIISFPIIVAIALFQSRFKDKAIKKMLGNYGVYIFGESISWRLKPFSFFRERFAKYGDVFYTRLSHHPISLLLENNKPIKNTLTKILARFGLLKYSARTCICERITPNVYSFELFNLLSNVLESDGAERKITESTHNLFNRVRIENFLLVDKIPAICTLIISTIVLDTTVIDVKLMELFQSYTSACNQDERYESENLIRSKIKVAFNQNKDAMKNWKDNLSLLNDDNDLSFVPTSGFLDLFLNGNNLSLEDKVTILFQFIVEQLYVPLVQQMKTLVESKSLNFLDAVNLYKAIVLKKKEPSSTNEKVALTSSSILSWISECSLPLDNNSKQKEGHEEQKKELINSFSLKLKTSKLDSTVSEYKTRIRLLVEESRKQTIFVPPRPVYYRATLNNECSFDESSNLLPKGVLHLKFPSDVMIDENYQPIERTFFFDVVLCSLTHQMISDFEWTPGSNFMDEIKICKDTHSKEAIRY